MNQAFTMCNRTVFKFVWIINKKKKELRIDHESHDHDQTFTFVPDDSPFRTRWILTLVY